ncbi:RluA family pseudouridine synthase [Litoribaculum gwangyangense]|uniref:Pseudouridine synthase n=1 Tax=Litoribaculum gwangyangense TaxID=1130722 RepID=A0ABP9CJZ9_9FLAO
MHPFSSLLFHPLKINTALSLPEKFTFPFYYEPHELSVLAAKDLQSYLETQIDFIHNFGLNAEQTGMVIGKMFGVMVVKNTQGDLGYLAAFSGKLADSNDVKGFVPTVYNTLNVTGFYKKGEAELNTINTEIDVLEHSSQLQNAKRKLMEAKSIFETELKSLKAKIKLEKKLRDQQRETMEDCLDSIAYNELLKNLKAQSISYQVKLKHLKRYWEQNIKELEDHLEVLKTPINDLKVYRANLSASLQKRIHEQYQFLNSRGESKDLLDIFKNTSSPIPPAGSGECAAPKLFQYAYKNNLKPIAMAEFWWGASPKSQVRKHKQFYPSCRSKCEPILGFMMQGLNVDINPIEQAISHEPALEIIYEDDFLLLVNKPHEFLSVPGKTISNSVLTKMQAYLPNASGPLLLHRLDMSTSGLLLVAKSIHIHKQLQKQFIERSIKKRYVALLDGVIPNTEGTINLPLRVDLDNRPQQLVCYQYGKQAITKYKVITAENGVTRIHFYPVTGRTHQLRVHAAHSQGLKTPIVGDDLYGTKAKRLYLHAESLTFIHPVTKKIQTITCNAPF